MHLHLSKSSFSQIFQWSHAAHSRPFQSCFQTRFVFEPKAMQSYDHFLNCANFQAFFWKLFTAAGSVGASARVVFPFAVAKVLLFAELTKYFTGKIQTNFHRFSHNADNQPLTPKTFSHTKTAPKKQCASRPTTHTLYNIRNEFFKKISVLLQFNNKFAQHHEKKGNDIQVVPKKMQWNSVRNLMCVGRYAEKM